MVTDASLFSSKINLITMTDRSMRIKSLVWLWILWTWWICKWFSMALRFCWRLRYIWEKTLKIIMIKFYKIVKILRAPRLVKKQSLIAPVNPWKIKVVLLKKHILNSNKVNIDECKGNHSCHVNAINMNALGSHVCECHAGYTGNERKCTHYSCLVVVELIDGKNVKKKEMLPLTLQSFL